MIYVSARRVFGQLCQPAQLAQTMQGVFARPEELQGLRLVLPARQVE
jgi:hypothetical protein